jgi:hypothetical protein
MISFFFTEGKEYHSMLQFMSADALLHFQQSQPSTAGARFGLD